MFDLCEPNPPNDSFRDLKVTFIREDSSSHVEYLIYDRTQDNLYDSLEEVLTSVQQSVDLPNCLLMKSILQDITRAELKIRQENNPIYTQIKNKLILYQKFKRRNNRQLRNEYAKLKAKDFSKEIISLIKNYEKFDYGDILTDAFQLLFMQKIGISLQTHMVSKESEEKIAIKKALKIKKLKTHTTKDPDNEEMEIRLEEMLEKRADTDINPSISKLKSFRDACECKIF